MSAAPQLNKETSNAKPGVSVIEAKPQMRNLRSDVTRFVPTNLRVKRDPVGKKKHSGEMCEGTNSNSQMLKNCHKIRVVPFVPKSANNLIIFVQLDFICI